MSTRKPVATVDINAAHLRSHPFNRACLILWWGFLVLGIVPLFILGATSALCGG